MSQRSVMNEVNNTFEQLRLSNPFKTPEGYLEGLESSLMERVAAAEVVEPRGWRAVVKPIIYMAAMFGVIFGMGYGVMALTHTSERLPSAPASESRVAAVDHGFLDASFIEYLDVASLESEEALGDEDIVSYLLDELSINDLASYLAQE